MEMKIIPHAIEKGDKAVTSWNPSDILAGSYTLLRCHCPGLSIKVLVRVIFICSTKKILRTWDLDGSAVTSTGCSSTGPWFDSQHLQGDTQLSKTPVPWDSGASFDIRCGIQIYIQAKHPHTSKLILKIELLGKTLKYITQRMKRTHRNTGLFWEAICMNWDFWCKKKKNQNKTSLQNILKEVRLWFFKVFFIVFVCVHIGVHVCRYMYTEARGQLLTLFLKSPPSFILFKVLLWL